MQQPISLPSIVAIAFLLVSVPIAHANDNLTADYIDNGDGTIHHKNTGINWKRCVEGMTWTGSACTGKANTYTWNEAQSLSAGKWKLPSALQLATIKKNNLPVYINTTVFPNTPNVAWSSTENAPNPNFALIYSFGFGTDYPFRKTEKHPVRLIRND